MGQKTTSDRFSPWDLQGLEVALLRRSRHARAACEDELLRKYLKARLGHAAIADTTPAAAADAIAEERIAAGRRPGGSLFGARRRREKQHPSAGLERRGIRA